jgi:hypothetical protein
MRITWLIAARDVRLKGKSKSSVKPLEKSPTHSKRIILKFPGGKSLDKDIFSLIAHEYGEIEDKILWQVAMIHIPYLIQQLEPLIPPLPSDN